MYLCLIFSITLIEEATLIRYACIVVSYLCCLFLYTLMRYLLVQRDQCCIRGSVRPREEEDL